MTEYRVRTDLSGQLPTDPHVRVLDWAPGRPEATIQLGKQAGGRFLDGWRAPREALDLLLLGATAYCADKTALRTETADGWTRSLEVSIPVVDPKRWQDSGVGSVLNFLTGDRWTVNTYEEPLSPIKGLTRVPEDVTPVGPIDAVCLFSGGLDSLTGVIDLLEEDPDRRLCLVSHNEGGQASTAQEKLVRELKAHYGPDRFIAKQLFLRPAPENNLQQRPLPSPRENTTRARSLLFLTTALALAASVGPRTPLYIPENGFIGINVPLTRARSGSYSTRTTHPHFIKGLQEAIHQLGVSNPILNPYRLKTKGEILAETLNPDLLQRLAPYSVSCSHPEAARYVQKRQGNCGYCFPCLIRRASMAHVGWDTDPQSNYAWDALTGKELLDRSTARAADLRAVINGAFNDRPDRDILRNGPIPDGEHEAFIRVWREGLSELQDWLHNASDHTKARLERHGHI
ncbi:Qat anti-phage system QueC-like protein QatC [Nocardioides conyzicola]|uniref:7-cyano-7-deazaguanine synthase n=1 Tax=Nocardioides conyzicola TaxID=1651781 RepID=A0ABP8X500_9ACTN